MCLKNEQMRYNAVKEKGMNIYMMCECYRSLSEVNCHWAVRTGNFSRYLPVSMIGVIAVY